MSRHRDVRNMNLEEELDDQAFSEGEEDLSPADYEQLMHGLEYIRGVLGPEEVSGISDHEIKDTLYHYYFDVEQSINWLMEEQQRKIAAQARKGDKPLPPPPDEDPDISLASPRRIQQFHALAEPPPGGVDRPNGPLIRLHQPDEYIPPLGDEDEEFYYDEDDVSSKKPLSTITEVTERTEYSRQWPLPVLTPQPPSRTASSWSSQTSYGDVIEPSLETPLDPNEIPPSPPESALQRLSLMEPPPSASTSRTQTPTPSTVNQSRDIPATNESLPHIPDYNSKSSGHPPQNSLLLKKSSSQLTARARTANPEAKPPSVKSRSKLSELASSRLSATTRSSQAFTDNSNSVITYPSLRPSSESVLSVNSDAQSTATGSSSMDRHVQRAIQAALMMEAVDNKPPSDPQSPSLKPPSKPPSIIAQSPPKASPVAFNSPPPVSPTANVPLSPPANIPIPAPTSAPQSPAIPAPAGRPPSKLAMLAQAKAQQQQAHWMPTPKKPAMPQPGRTLRQTHTEYLTPVANGPTATTAITTTYQSLSDLAALPRLPPSFPPPHQTPRTPSGGAPKPSKLALKSRKAQLKTEPEPETIECGPDLTLFASASIRSRASASPSPFAAVLVDDQMFQVGSPGYQKGRKSGRSHKHRGHSPVVPLSPLQGFTFNSPSPDDIVFNARQGSSLAQRSNPSHSASSNSTSNSKSSSSKSSSSKSSSSKSSSSSSKSSTSSSSTSSTSSAKSSSSVSTARPIKASAAKEKEKQEKALKLAQQKKAAEATTKLTATSKKGTGAKKSGTSTPVRSTDSRQLDIAALNLEDEYKPPVDEPPPKISVAREKVLEEAKKQLEGTSDKKSVSLVVIGHVDAGKSTLMGRLLYELGRVDEKTRVANERASSKIGKSSFSWAWELDGTTEERERGITMDVALQTFATPHRNITILDAPGHKDFIPNMISGASQADCAVLVVDAAVGEFEAGFERGGQTREHLLLARSLGVSQVVIAINKLDQVQWSRARYEEICELLRPFLVQSGFHPSKTKFVPVGAMAGVNLVTRNGAESQELTAWYKGPTLCDLLDGLEPPTRDLNAPLRFPVANVFRTPSSAVAISGRVCSGLVQVGERLRVVPGDESALVKAIESEEEKLEWAAAGSNVTLHLTAIDPRQISIGSVLCPPSDVIPLITTFNARIIVFDIQVPITAGTSVELFHHSRDVPASISKLLATLDRASGTTIRKNPRVLTKSMSAEVQITLRSATISGPAARAQPIPLEPFSVNKEMGRVLIRRGGETIGAGIVTELVANNTT